MDLALRNWQTNLGGAEAMLFFLKGEPYSFLGRSKGGRDHAALQGPTTLWPGRHFGSWHLPDYGIAAALRVQAAQTTGPGGNPG